MNLDGINPNHQLTFLANSAQSANHVSQQLAFLPETQRGSLGNNNTASTALPIVQGNTEKGINQAEKVLHPSMHSLDLAAPPMPSTTRSFSLGGIALRSVLNFLGITKPKNESVMSEKKAAAKEVENQVKALNTAISNYAKALIADSPKEKLEELRQGLDQQIDSTVRHTCKDSSIMKDWKNSINMGRRFLISADPQNESLSWYVNQSNPPADQLFLRSFNPIFFKEGDKKFRPYDKEDLGHIANLSLLHKALATSDRSNNANYIKLDQGFKTLTTLYSSSSQLLLQPKARQEDLEKELQKVRNLKKEIDSIPLMQNSTNVKTFAAGNMAIISYVETLSKLEMALLNKLAPPSTT